VSEVRNLKKRSQPTPVHVERNYVYVHTENLISMKGKALSASGSVKGKMLNFEKKFNKKD
jgi:hypothetical protein